MSHDLSHSHSKILELQTKKTKKKNSLSHMPLSINVLLYQLHLLLLQCCLLLKTFASNLHIHFQVSCHSICIFLFVLEIRLNTLTFMFLTIRGTRRFPYGSIKLLQQPVHLFTSTL